MISMAEKISIDDARRIVADVAPQQCFWVNNGPIVRNLDELAKSLEYMKDETFWHHVNPDKNDFANWARDVLRDEALAESLKKLKSKEGIANSIRKRIKTLERIVDKVESE